MADEMILRVLEPEEPAAAVEASLPLVRAFLPNEADAPLLLSSVDNLRRLRLAGVSGAGAIVGLGRQLTIVVILCRSFDP